MSAEQNILGYASSGDPLRDLPCRLRVDLAPLPAWPQLLLLILALLAMAWASLLSLAIVVERGYSGQTYGAAKALLIVAPVSAAFLLVAWSLFREAVQLARHGGRHITVAVTDSQLIIHNPSAWNPPLRSWPRTDLACVDVAHLGLMMALRPILELRVRSRDKLNDTEVRFTAPTSDAAVELRRSLLEALRE
jgi:hypothetical protein